MCSRAVHHATLFVYLLFMLCYSKFCFTVGFFSALETLDVDKVYVLGGLVDESIQKV